MKSKALLTIPFAVLLLILSGCGGTSNCPTCGATNGGQGYSDILNIPVPEHNPTGEPGGPFNSFDISWENAATRLDYVSDRIGLAVVVIDTNQNLAVNALQGSNAVAGAGNQASPCDPSIPPLISVFGNFTRFGCRNPPFHLASGFGANGNFGGFPGAQCCASRGNGVNPMSGPDGEEVTPNGNVLFSGNGSSSVVVWDLSTMDLSKNPPSPPNILAVIPTGVAADYDGPLGLAACIASWNGEAGSSASCGDDRADEMAYDPVHQVLAVIDGDPGLPFVTLIDVSNIVNKTGTPAQQHCLPIDAASPYGPYPAPPLPSPYPAQGTLTSPVTPAPGASFNPPSCILGQIYYDGAGGTASGGLGLNPNVPVDTVGGTFPCPDPSNPQTFGGVSGSLNSGIPGVGVTPSGANYTIPCHHGPILDTALGTFCSQASPSGTCSGAISPAGLGGMVWNPNTGHLLLTNANSVGVTSVGAVDEIDPRLGNANGPVVVNTFVMTDCMPTSVVQGPGNNFLVGCADHDGQAFPPNEYIIDGTSGNILTTINNVGGVDEVWFNPGDNRYYLAARDMPNGPVLGVIDAINQIWLQNVATNTNSHSVTVDPVTNHAFVPMQTGGPCGTQSSNGCIGVFSEQ